ncbi:hypothetical protein DVH05_011173 [Phytophthora capsici]|nr:hypothetical protein DVH05_011173 [Phytophthora capsici]
MLTDFGMSFFESGSYSLRSMKDTLGAMQWRAPEFAMLSVETPTHKSDVYSLGMCIVQAVNYADYPWGESFTSDGVRDKLRHGTPDVNKPEAMTDTQWELVKRMIAISPGDRPDLAEVMTSLKEFAKAERDEQLDKECPY